MTKEQRLSFYKELLRVVCDEPTTHYGYCNYISYEMNHWYHTHRIKPVYAYRDAEFKRYFPELYKTKPNNNFNYMFLGYWFPNTSEGWQIRIDNLVKVIEKMEASVKKSK